MTEIVLSKISYFFRVQFSLECPLIERRVLLVNVQEGVFHRLKLALDRAALLAVVKEALKIILIDF